MLDLVAWGHSCVSVRATVPSGSVHVLLDPGDLTAPLDAVGSVDAVLVTHEHADHLDLNQLQRIDPAGGVPVYGPGGVLKQLASGGRPGATAVTAGPLDLGGLTVEVMNAPHELIHPELPLPENLAYLIDGCILAPGDSFLVPPSPVDTLLLPIGGPWLKLAETIEYLRALTPRRAILVHGAGLAPAHQHLARMLITKLAPTDTEVIDPVAGKSIRLSA